MIALGTCAPERPVVLTLCADPLQQGAFLPFTMRGAPASTACALAEGPASRTRSPAAWPASRQSP
eukprot:2062795-Pleurochrysis_carterae.AAC.3